MTLPLLALGGLLAVALVVVVREMRRYRRAQLLTALLAMFGPVAAKARSEPRELVEWVGVAATARVLFPDLFRDLDAASGGRFPFPTDLVEQAHARWTSQWLAWERAHDLEYRRRSDDVEAKLAGASPNEVSGVRAQLSAIEQEKLQRYQDRYEEYVRLGKALSELE